MADLAACAIVKNEGAYIYEWLSFHHVVGVERFFIYDNNSTDDTRAEIARWPLRDRVTVIDWPHVPGQLAAYHHMLAHHRDAATWCAFIDCDEFLCPRGPISVRDFLYEMSPLCDTLYVHWLMFGSSGQVARTPGPVTERFLRRGHADFGPNLIGKSITRLATGAVPSSPHVVRGPGRFVNEMNVALDTAATAPGLRPSHRFIALNHYFTKSLEEWRQRRALGMADHGPAFIRPEREFRHHDVNDVLDVTAANIMQQARRLFY